MIGDRSSVLLRRGGRYIQHHYRGSTNYNWILLLLKTYQVEQCHFTFGNWETFLKRIQFERQHISLQIPARSAPSTRNVSWLWFRKTFLCSGHDILLTQIILENAIHGGVVAVLTPLHAGPHVLLSHNSRMKMELSCFELNICAEARETW